MRLEFAKVFFANSTVQVISLKVFYCKSFLPYGMLGRAKKKSRPTISLPFIAIRTGCVHFIQILDCPILEYGNITFGSCQ